MMLTSYLDEFHISNDCNICNDSFHFEAHYFCISPKFSVINENEKIYNKKTLYDNYKSISDGHHKFSGFN